MSERKRIYLCLAHMSEDGMEQKYVKEAFDTNWVVPLGPNVNGFEKDLEEFVAEGKRVVALSAGTAAVLPVPDTRAADRPAAAAGQAQHSAVSIQDKALSDHSSDMFFRHAHRYAVQCDTRRAALRSPSTSWA